MDHINDTLALAAGAIVALVLLALFLESKFLVAIARAGTCLIGIGVAMAAYPCFAWTMDGHLRWLRLNDVLTDIGFPNVATSADSAGTLIRRLSEFPLGLELLVAGLVMACYGVVARGDAVYRRRHRNR